MQLVLLMCWRNCLGGYLFVFGVYTVAVTVLITAFSGAYLTAFARQILDSLFIIFFRLEHWDVNNENLHGQWFQNRLNDPGYNVELFREAHQVDPNIKLFLNDYNVVANWASTGVSYQETSAEQTTRA